MRRSMRRLLLLLVGAAVVLLVGVFGGVDWGSSVVVRDADGGTVLRSPLPRSGEFWIE